MECEKKWEKENEIFFVLLWIAHFILLKFFKRLVKHMSSPFCYW